MALVEVKAQQKIKRRVAQRRLDCRLSHRRRDALVAPAHARIAVLKLGTRLDLREAHDGKKRRADKVQPRDVKGLSGETRRQVNVPAMSKFRFGAPVYDGPSDEIAAKRFGGETKKRSLHGERGRAGVAGL